MKYTFELNNARYDEVQIKDESKFKKFVEICSALWSGADLTKYGKEADGVVTKMKDLGARAEAGDWRARSEINEVIKFMIQPKLIESMKVFNFLGNYHEIGYNQQPQVESYTYEGIDARRQASGATVNFAGKKWLRYPVATSTISSGMAIDYRELASGNFGGNVAEETAQIQIDMNNKAIAYVLDILTTALKGNTQYVKFYAEYSSAPTMTAVEAMVAKVRKFGKVTIAGDYSVLSVVGSWNGYLSIGATPTYVPFSSPAQVDELARAGLNGFYKGSALMELPNPYNVTKPLADLTAFETYYDTDKLYFLAQGAPSPLHIFRRGGMTTMSGNDVDTGTIKTRFDMEVGADVVKGREFEIGMLAKEA